MQTRALPRLRAAAVCPRLVGSVDLDPIHMPSKRDQSICSPAKLQILKERLGRRTLPEFFASIFCLLRRVVDPLQKFARRPQVIQDIPRPDHTQLTLVDQHLERLDGTLLCAPPWHGAAYHGCVHGTFGRNFFLYIFKKQKQTIFESFRNILPSVC